MSPTSAKRRSARKREPTSKSLNNHEATTTTTPSRPSKRRKTTAPRDSDPPANVAHGEPMDDEQEDETSSQGEPMNDVRLTKVADEVLPLLKEAKYEALVRFEHPNQPDMAPVVEAYAAIHGKDWTFYVKQPKVYIGRCPDKPIYQDDADHGKGLPDNINPDDVIDLGPSKLVSRIHATIYWTEGGWMLEVNGRNGVRINEQMSKKSRSSIITSGDVIEVAGTEMLFLSPDIDPEVHPAILARKDPVKVEQLAQGQQPWTTYQHAHPDPQGPPHQHTSPYPAHPFANGHPILAPAPSQFPRPSTPVNSQQVPYLTPGTASSPAFGQTAMMDVEAKENIDYSLDASRACKPPCSYATLIAQAILSADRDKMSLHNIYEWIKTHFAYYRHLEQGWQNSIRHNLSLNPAFIKVPRESHEPGKGGLWTIIDSKIEEFRNSGMKLTPRGGARRSGQNSPARRRTPTQPNDSPALSSPALRTPNGGTTLTAHSPDHRASLQAPLGLAFTQTTSEMRTPSRETHLGRTSADPSSAAQAHPHFAENATPGPVRPLPSGTATSPLPHSTFLADDATQAFSLYTPAPRRHEPRLTAPSTAKLPSHYLPQSSPAPFWRSVGEMGSTPARFPDTSPVKHDMNRARDAEFAAKAVPSSSPPGAGMASPIRNRIEVKDVMRSGARGQGHEDEGDDGGGALDLMGQFPKIGDRMVSSAAH